MSRSVVRNGKAMRIMMRRPMWSSMESKHALAVAGPQTGGGDTSMNMLGNGNGVNSEAFSFSGTIMARMTHEDSNQYKINVEKKLGPDADPYAHTPDTVSTNSAMQSPPKDEHEAEGLLHKYDADSVNRPYGSFSEQTVAADRSHIDPLSEHRKVRQGKVEEGQKMSEEGESADSSPIYGGK